MSAPRGPGDDLDEEVFDYVLEHHGCLRSDLVKYIKHRDGVAFNDADIAESIEELLGDGRLVLSTGETGCEDPVRDPSNDLGDSVFGANASHGKATLDQVCLALWSANEHAAKAIANARGAIEKLRAADSQDGEHGDGQDQDDAGGAPGAGALQVLTDTEGASREAADFFSRRMKNSIRHAEGLMRHLQSPTEVGDYLRREVDKHVRALLRVGSDSSSGDSTSGLGG